MLRKYITLSILATALGSAWALPPSEAGREGAAPLQVKWDQDSLCLRYGDKTYNMVYVPAGSFNMGATGKLSSGSSRDEWPQPLVSLDGYFIGQSEVPQWLWVAVMEKNPSQWKGDMLPVENVSWISCQYFTEKLADLTGLNFRLPTEAEWEFAAREGKPDFNCLYSGSDDIDEVAWYRKNSDNVTHEVMTKKPNALGIYDMTGNVAEWCMNGKFRYSYGTVINPHDYGLSERPAYRGGSGFSKPRGCRVSQRMSASTNRANGFLGLRLCIGPN